MVTRVSNSKPTQVVSQSASSSKPATLPKELSRDAVKAFLAKQGASLPPEVKVALEKAVAQASWGGTVDVSKLADLGANGAEAWRALARSAEAAPSKNTGWTTTKKNTVADSILNGAGQGNVSGQNGALGDNLPLSVVNGKGRQVRFDGKKQVADPNSVMTRNTGVGVSPEIMQIVTSRAGAPKTAERVAAKLAELYGPFTASNTEANRKAILQNLQWMADTSTGIKYNNDRLNDGSNTTQSPNQTLSTRSGVCRDIHTAASAVMASLINARKEGDKWVPGPPTGQESNVQTLEFATPAEYHAYMVYKDPTTGGWNALEYGKNYQLNAPTSVDAFRNLPGYIPGYKRYEIRGWDEKPVVNQLGSVGATAAKEFFKSDPGVGTAGETRLQVSGKTLEATHFINSRLALTGKADATDLDNGLKGGIKLNYHEDFENADTKGYLRVAGGLYADSYNASKWTGLRGADDRERYDVYVVGIKADGRLEGKPHELAGEHLKASYGVDIDGLAGIPFAKGAGLQANSIPDYSEFKLGADAGLSGRERLSPNLDLDWAVRYRHTVDLQQLSAEVMTSEGETAKRSLLQDAARTDFALALTHKGPGGTTTRFEAGGSQYLFAPQDGQTTPSEQHYAVLTVAPESGRVDFGVVARGETLDGKFLPVNSLGVALNLNPTKNISVGAGVSSVFPDGDTRKIGDNLQVTGSVKIKF